MNNVVLIGRLVRDPDLRFIPSTGRAVANFSLAVDKGLSREKKEEFKAQGKQTADFINIVVYGKPAENCANYLAKGRMCAINGRISTRSYTANNGERKYITEVVANNVEFIEWGEKRQPTSGGSGGVSSNDNPFDNFTDDENDIFQPVDDEEIPF